MINFHQEKKSINFQEQTKQDSATSVPEEISCGDFYNPRWYMALMSFTPSIMNAGILPLGKEENEFENNYMEEHIMIFIPYTSFI